MNNSFSRRDFIQKAAITAGALPFVSLNQPKMAGRPDQAGAKSAAAASAAALPPILVFSKHLQFLDYAEMAQKAKEIGFDGIDLTVRPKGHVLPERVKTDLPKAVDAIKKAGLQPLMITTAVEDANGTDETVLRTAAEQGIKYYRMNWYKYNEQESMPETIQHFQDKIKALSELNSKLGITGCYQNHAGKLIGASAWELWALLQKANTDAMGLQYDIRHAVVEGGMSWENSVRLLHQYIDVLAIKDFLWVKEKDKYVVKNVPMGEGMVDFGTFFKLLKQYNVNVPISMHYEYDLGGAEHGDKTIKVGPQVVYDAMKKDLQKVKELWTQV